MSHMHRLIWFDQQLRMSVYPNRGTLAEKFEISIRQAQRDIDYLKNSLGAPIRYDAKRRGFYYEDTSYTLPNVYINDIQKKMLKFLAYRYENYIQTPKVVQMSELFRRLADEEEIDDGIPIFDLAKPVVQSYYSIYNAIHSKNKLSMLYKDSYRGTVQVKIDPYKLFYKYKADYLVGYDNDTGEFNIFRLDRIEQFEVLTESFEIRTNFEEKKYSGFVEKEPYIAKIKWNSQWDIKVEKGMKIRHLEGLIYEIEFYEIDELMNLLINTGCWERILTPKWLKNKIIKRCEEIIKKVKER